MGLYISSLFILFALIAYLFYNLNYSYQLDDTRHKLQLKAHQLSSKIIFAHMNDKFLDLDMLSKSDYYDVSFLDKNKKLIFGKRLNVSDLSKPFIIQDDKIILIDKGSFGHLGVNYIIISDSHFKEKIDLMQREIIFYLMLSYIVVLIVGYFLAKLFIKPIRLRRIQLDNFIKESTHELNTPISALLMSVDAKKESADRNDERIKISAKRVADIYKDLTYLFLRDETDKKDEPLDLTEILKREIEALYPLAQRKKIRFRQEYKNPLIFTINGESATRLISNLLSNAVKYNKFSGTIDISVEGKKLIIKDSGIGISKKAQKEVFKRFYRANSSEGGFGLGLNIVYKICRQYGIKIELFSKKGEGTTFILNF